MNNYIINYFFIISIFPVWIFRSNLENIEIFFLILLFTLFFIFHYFFLNKILNNKKIRKFYLSFIISIGIDQIMGLWNGFIIPLSIFLNKYLYLNILSILFLGLTTIIILTFIIYFLFIRQSPNAFKIILVFLSTIFIFNLFDNTKSFNKIPFFDSSKNIQSNKIEQSLIVILDEMSGINSPESKDPTSEEFLQNVFNLIKKYEFVAFPNAYSFSDTLDSILSSLNFDTSNNNIHKYIRKSKKYYNTNEVISNLTFDRFKDISIYQNININYCNHNNVKKCTQYNPFTEKNFITGYKNTTLTKIFSIWEINGSISARLLAKVFKQFRIIDSSLEPRGGKASIESTFNKIYIDIKSNKFDLIFSHILVPHMPYGFDNNCNYDGGLSNTNLYLTDKQKIKQHNIERKCVINYLESLLVKLKKQELLKNLKIIIMSDTGAKIENYNNKFLSTFFILKERDAKFFIDNNKISNQEIFLKIFQ